MAATDPADEISELSSKLDTIEAVIDPDAMRTEAADLREQAADPGLWEHQARAQQVTRRLSYLEGELARLESLRQRLDDTETCCSSLLTRRPISRHATKPGLRRPAILPNCARRSRGSRSAPC